MSRTLLALKLALSAVFTTALYGAFFTLGDSLVPVFTSQTLLGAVAVVVTAMIFSFVHGAFARYLLETLGL